MKHFLTALALASLFCSVPSVASAQEAQVVTPAKVEAPVKVDGPTLTVGPNTLTRGSTATITYSNPNKAGQTVLVTIDNGMRRNTEVQTVEIHLDANGQGSANWVVPNWYAANFNADGALEVNRSIL